jgi:hypothetical protein
MNYGYTLEYNVGDIMFVKIESWVFNGNAANGYRITELEMIEVTL